MKIKTHISDDMDPLQLVEIKLEGCLYLNPVECREFLNVIARTGLADMMVMRVGASTEWVKLIGWLGHQASDKVVYMYSTATTSIRVKGESR